MIPKWLIIRVLRAKAVLQVIDAPFDGSRPQVLQVFKFNPNNDIDQSNSEIAEGMRNLPIHNTETARILDVTIHSDFVITGLRETKGPESTRLARGDLINFLRETYTQQFEERRIFRWLNDPIPVNDIGSISSQWSQHFGRGGKQPYRLVNLIIVNDVWSEQTFNVYGSGDSKLSIPFQNPRYTFVKLLLLDFFLASIYLQAVDHYGSVIWPKLATKKEMLRFPLTKNPHLQVPLGLFEPRLSAKSREAFKEIENAEGILRSVNNLVDSVVFVLKALEQNVASHSFQQSARKDYEGCKQTLEGLIEERKSNASRALDALSRQLDYLTKRHAIREAKSIKILTILASFYLPLSLSASLLGMSSPFKFITHDITEPAFDTIGSNLLFDFFGVFIWLATSTIFVVYGIRLAFWLKADGLARLAELVGLSKWANVFGGSFSIFSYGQRWRFGGKGGWMFEKIKAATAWWIGVGFCVTLLAC
ncbi:hypothetical protein Daus18300_012133 [Diaporthe australafricana]|uniref:Ankyrin repeat protein n=1 Tax=Diaporthe australafricana TaxID=127596 RepID=A0ABR3W3Z4_9PEZI